MCHKWSRSCLPFQSTWVHHLVFSGVRVIQSLVLYECFVDCCLSFSTYLLAIVFSFLPRYTDSDYLFGIFKLFLLYDLHALSVDLLTIFTSVLPLWKKDNYIYLFVFICIYMYLFVFICIYLYLFVFICIYMYLFVFICTYLYLFTYTGVQYHFYCR